MYKKYKLYCLSIYIKRGITFMYYIKNALMLNRFKKNITQKLLCKGLCSTTQLSRFENGQKYPTKIMFNTLMERLGESSDGIPSLTSEVEINYINTRNKYINLLHEDPTNAKMILIEDKNMLLSKNKFDKQLVYAIYASTETKVIKQLELYYKALSYTIPDFDIDMIPNFLFSHMEITIICSISNCYKQLGNIEKAIQIYSSLLNYTDIHIHNKNEKNKNIITICSYLAKLLLDTKNYIEALHYAIMGIRACSGYELNNSKTLPLLYSTKCICLYKLKKYKEAKECALYTYHILQVFCTSSIRQEILLELYNNTDIKFD